jgi:hypothetical protein
VRTYHACAGHVANNPEDTDLFLQEDSVGLVAPVYQKATFFITYLTVQRMK